MLLAFFIMVVVNYFRENDKVRRKVIDVFVGLWHSMKRWLRGEEIKHPIPENVRKDPKSFVNPKDLRISELLKEISILKSRVANSVVGPPPAVRLSKQSKPLVSA